MNHTHPQLDRLDKVSAPEERVGVRKIHELGATAQSLRDAVCDLDTTLGFVLSSSVPCGQEDQCVSENGTSSLCCTISTIQENVERAIDHINEIKSRLEV